MANEPTPPTRPIDPHFVERMDRYWREQHEPTPTQGGNFHPLDFPLMYPSESPWHESGGYFAPSEDAPHDPSLDQRYIQPAGPIHQSHPGYPQGGFYQGDWGDWGQQQYPHNPIDYQAPWNSGAYQSWPGYLPAQPFTPEWDYLWEGPFAGGGPMQSGGQVAQMQQQGQGQMQQQMQQMMQQIPYGQQLGSIAGYLSR